MVLVEFGRVDEHRLRVGPAAALCKAGNVADERERDGEADGDYCDHDSATVLIFILVLLGVVNVLHSRHRRVSSFVSLKVRKVVLLHLPDYGSTKLVS